MVEAAYTAAIIITVVLSAFVLRGARVAICFWNWLFSSFPHPHVVLRFQGSVDKDTTSTKTRSMDLTLKSKILDDLNCSADCIRNSPWAISWPLRAARRTGWMGGWVQPRFHPGKATCGAHPAALRLVLCLQSWECREAGWRKDCGFG